MRRAIQWLLLVMVVSPLARFAVAYPPMRNLSEMLPPTDEEWFLHYLAKERRKTTTECVMPILLYERLYVYLCPWNEPCGAPTHVSFRGYYGIFYPGPYYLETPTLEVQFPEPCPRRRPFLYYTVESDSPLIP